MGGAPATWRKYQLFVASFKYLIMWFYKGISKSWSGTQGYIKKDKNVLLIAIQNDVFWKNNYTYKYWLGDPELPKYLVRAATG